MIIIPKAQGRLTVIPLQLGLHQLCPHNFEILSIINRQAKALSIMPALYSRTIFETFLRTKTLYKLSAHWHILTALYITETRISIIFIVLAHYFAFFYKKIEVL